MHLEFFSEEVQKDPIVAISRKKSNLLIKIINYINAIF